MSPITSSLHAQMSSCQSFPSFRSGFLSVCCPEFELFILNCLRPVNEDNNFSGTTDLLTSAVLIAGLFLFPPFLSLNHTQTLTATSIMYFPSKSLLCSSPWWHLCPNTIRAAIIVIFYRHIVSHVVLAVVLEHRYSHKTRLSLLL